MPPAPFDVPTGCPPAGLLAAFVRGAPGEAGRTAVLGHLASPADLSDADTRTPAGVR